jgi:hypothetical protein
MAKVLPTVDDFVDKFPEFANVAEGAVQFAIDLGKTFVGEQWDDEDYFLGALLASAHFLELMPPSAKEDPNTASTSTDDTDVFIRSVSVGGRRMTLATPAEVQGQSRQFSAASDQQFANTQYGQWYLMLLRRNVAPIVVV